MVPAVLQHSCPAVHGRCAPALRVHQHKAQQSLIQWCAVHFWRHDAHQRVDALLLQYSVHVAPIHVTSDMANAANVQAQPGRLHTEAAAAAVVMQQQLQ